MSRDKQDSRLCEGLEGVLVQVGDSDAGRQLYGWQRKVGSAEERSDVFEIFPEEVSSGSSGVFSFPRRQPTTSKPCLSIVGVGGSQGCSGFSGQLVELGRRHALVHTSGDFLSHQDLRADGEGRWVAHLACGGWGQAIVRWVPLRQQWPPAPGRRSLS